LRIHRDAWLGYGLQILLGAALVGVAGCDHRSDTAMAQVEPPPAEKVGPGAATEAVPAAEEPPAPDQSQQEQLAGSTQPPPRNDAAVINFEGFGPAHFGDNEEAVRVSWGRPLKASKPAPGATCYYLVQDPQPEGAAGIAFMLEDGRFVRYDVDVPLQVAPGDIVVGDTVEKVSAAHAGHSEEQPHKYVEGAKNLIVTPPAGGTARLVFEISPQGRVERWRIGLPPQIFYVEGCS
jgi:hypothetical protein